MAFETKLLTFTANTANGNQDLTGCSFTPKAAIVWTEGVNNSADTFSNAHTFCYGFTDGTNSRVINKIAEDAQAQFSDTSDTQRNDSLIYNISQTSTATIRNVATFVEWLTNSGMRINWSTAPASAFKFHVLFIGGSDITNVQVGSWTPDLSSSTTASLTGLSFQPDFIQILNKGDESRTANVNVRTDEAGCFGIGCATSSSSQWCLATTSEDGRSISDSWQYQDDAAIIQELVVNTGAKGLTGTLTSINSDGFTVSFSATGAASHFYPYLAIKGGSFATGKITEPDSTGNQTTTTNKSVKAVQLFGIGTATQRTSTANDYLSVGAGTSTTGERVVTFYGDLDNQDPSVVVSRYETSSIYLMAVPAATATSSTINEEADLDSVSSTGFTLNWTNIGGALPVYYVTFGDSAAGTTPVSTTKTHKYNIIQQISAVNKTHKYNIVGKVTNSKTHKFHILNAISTSKTHKYDIFKIVTLTKTHIYSIVSSVLSTKTHLYNILNAVVPTATKTHLYNVVSTVSVSTTKTHKYNVVASISVSKTHLYNVISAVLPTKTHKYNVISLTSTTKTHKYNVLITVSTTKTHKYHVTNIISPAPATKTHKYTILNTVSTATKTHLWHILQFATADKTHLYNVIAIAATTKTHKYNVEGLISTTKTHKYNVLNTVTPSADKTHKYTILNTVSGATKTHKYNLLNVITSAPATKTHKYNIISLVTTTKTHKYNLESALSQVSTTKTHKYNITGLATTTKTHKYSIISSVSPAATKTHKYSIITVISAVTKTHKYNVSGQFFVANIDNEPVVDVSAGSVSKILTAIKAISETPSITIDETIARTQSLIKEISETPSVSANDSVAAGLHFIVSLIESRIRWYYSLVTRKIPEGES